MIIANPMHNKPRHLLFWMLPGELLWPIVAVTLFAKDFVTTGFLSRTISLHSRQPHDDLQSIPTSDTDSVFQFANKLVRLSEELTFSEDAILAQIDRQLADDCAASRALPIELDNNIGCKVAIHYEWTRVLQYNLAVQSLEPILDEASISAIRQRAEDLWKNPSKGATSRFTYQRSGNYEAHVSGLGRHVYDIMEKALSNHIYPLVRHAFFNESNSRLCVYDALVIRYNSTEAQQAAQWGAGQPLHRDLGVVSVNIMLNEPGDFHGGGTFFENQLMTDDSCAPLKPHGLGHCLAHYSSERHAGANTYQGVRDIMVLFIMADQKPPPPLMRNTRLKQCRDVCSSNDIMQSIQCRISRQLLAAKLYPEDGEAYQYLGTALMDYAAISSKSNLKLANSALEVAVQCLQHASKLTPCDARVYNNLGLALSKKISRNPQDIASIINAYEKSLKLLERSEQIGCDVQDDMDSVRLNYGLYLSNQNSFEQAASVLYPLACRWLENCANGRIVEDAHRLWRFCEKKEMTRS